MSVYFDILTSCETGLKNDVNLTGINGMPGIDDSAIVLRLQSFGSDSKQWASNELLPGIVISPGRHVSRPPQEGTNQTDDAHYLVNFQIVDHEQDRLERDRLNTWTTWMERIAKYFHHSNLKLNVFSSAGYVNRVVIPEISPFDERMFAIHQRCVMAHVIDVVAREPRDATGTA